MRKIQILFLVMLGVSLRMTGNELSATNPDTLWIKTSAQCEMCKETIEKALAYERGVVASDLDLKTKQVWVIYHPAKTTPEKIRRAISKSGYDADEVMADPKAYRRLPRCCKKPQDR